MCYYVCIYNHPENWTICCVGLLLLLLVLLFRGLFLGFFLRRGAISCLICCFKEQSCFRQESGPSTPPPLESTTAIISQRGVGARLSWCDKRLRSSREMWALCGVNWLSLAGYACLWQTVSTLNTHNINTDGDCLGLRTYTSWKTIMCHLVLKGSLLKHLQDVTYKQIPEIRFSLIPSDYSHPLLLIWSHSWIESNSLASRDQIKLRSSLTQ